jgi:hypothetical protein
LKLKKWTITRQVPLEELFVLFLPLYVCPFSINSFQLPLRYLSNFSYLFSTYLTVVVLYIDCNLFGRIIFLTRHFSRVLLYNCWTLCLHTVCTRKHAYSVKFIVWSCIRLILTNNMFALNVCCHFPSDRFKIISTNNHYVLLLYYK